MFPASLAACVPEFIATATSACASAGASLVRHRSSPPGARRPAAGGSARVWLRAWPRRGSRPLRLRGDGRGRERIVAGDHHGLDPHPPQFGEALADAALDTSFNWIAPSTTPSSPRPAASSRTARSCPRRRGPRQASRRRAASRTPRSPRRRPCAPRARPGSRRSCGAGAERHEGGAQCLQVALAQSVAFLGEHDDAAPLGVSSASEASCAASASRSTVTPGPAPARWPGGCRA